MVLGLGSSNVKFYDTGFTADKSDPLGQEATFGYKLWTGAKVIDPMAITAVHSASRYDIALNDGTYLNEGKQKVDVPSVTAGTNSIPDKWEL
jgi:hypothetical protein